MAGEIRAYRELPSTVVVRGPAYLKPANQAFDATARLGQSVDRFNQQMTDIALTDMARRNDIAADDAFNKIMLGDEQTPGLSVATAEILQREGEDSDKIVEDTAKAIRDRRNSAFADVNGGVRRRLREKFDQRTERIMLQAAGAQASAVKRHQDRVNAATVVNEVNDSSSEFGIAIKSGQDPLAAGQLAEARVGGVIDETSGREGYSREERDALETKYVSELHSNNFKRLKNNGRTNDARVYLEEFGGAMDQGMREQLASTIKDLSDAGEAQATFDRIRSEPEDNWIGEADKIKDPALRAHVTSLLEHRQAKNRTDRRDEERTTANESMRFIHDIVVGARTGGRPDDATLRAMIDRQALIEDPAKYQVAEGMITAYANGLAIVSNPGDRDKADEQLRSPDPKVIEEIRNDPEGFLYKYRLSEGDRAERRAQIAELNAREGRGYAITEKAEAEKSIKASFAAIYPNIWKSKEQENIDRRNRYRDEVLEALEVEQRLVGPGNPIPPSRIKEVSDRLAREVTVLRKIPGSGALHARGLGRLVEKKIPLTDVTQIAPEDAHTFVATPEFREWYLERVREQKGDNWNIKAVQKRTGRSARLETVYEEMSEEEITRRVNRAYYDSLMGELGER